MNDNTRSVIALLADMAIFQNKGRDAHQGVLFSAYSSDGAVHHEAFAVSEVMIVRVSEFGEFTFDQHAPFYHYQERGFLRNQMLVNSSDLHRKISSYDFVHAIRVPTGNLANFIFNNFPDGASRGRARAIIKPQLGEIPQGYVLCRFDANGMFSHPLAPGKVFRLAQHSKIRLEDISPNKIYLCRADAGSEHEVIVNAKAEYFRGVQIALHETVGGTGFFVDERELFAFDYYPAGRVLSLPFVLPGSYQFKPVQVDTNYLTEAVKILGGFEWIDIVVGNSNTDPILLTGVRDNAPGPLIQIYLAVLNPQVRGDVR